MVGKHGRKETIGLLDLFLIAPRRFIVSTPAAEIWQACSMAMPALRRQSRTMMRADKPSGRPGAAGHQMRDAGVDMVPRQTRSTPVPKLAGYQDRAADIEKMRTSTTIETSAPALGA